MTALADKTNTALQAAIDKFGAVNCFTKTATVEASNLITLAQNAANSLCLVPSPTPTP